MIKWLNCVWQGAAIAALFAGCSDNTSTAEVEQKKVEEIAVILVSWIGKSLVLPTDVGFFTTDGDSVNAAFPTEEFKIVRYIGKDDCTSCRLHLIRYPKLLSELSERTDCQVGLVNIINPANMDDVRRLLWRDNYGGLTMWIDEADSLNRLNGFPEIGALQTFLVDKDNRVLAVGDPAVNPRVMRLFVDVLRSDSVRARSERRREALTELMADAEERELGVVAAGDTARRRNSARGGGGQPGAAAISRQLTIKKIVCYE